MILRTAILAELIRDYTSAKVFESMAWAEYCADSTDPEKQIEWGRCCREVDVTKRALKLSGIDLDAGRWRDLREDEKQDLLSLRLDARTALRQERNDLQNLKEED